MAMPTKKNKQTKKPKTINNTNSKKDKVCNYCKIKEHLESTCYKKFPEKRPKK